MEGEKAPAQPQIHRSGSDLFICFTARPSSSSSSMRISSSKSLPSPGRTAKYRDQAQAPPPSLSASLSRRLRSNGSVKGGQSPAMFPAVAGSRKKTGAFEAAEPSSPKVTCIGQVRVKTTRKKKVMRSRSRRMGAGEVSFRRAEGREGGGEGDCLPNRNQRWVHLPLSSVCCFLPCGGGRSPCSSSSSSGTGGDREKGAGGEKRARGMGSCGAGFARWLMAVQEGEEDVKRREAVELVVEDMDVGMKEAEVVVGEEEEKGAVKKEEAEEEEEEEEEESVSVCIPPRNALLLMRCRSDPVRMAALATRFWGSPGTKVEVEEVDERLEEEVDGSGGDVEMRKEEVEATVETVGKEAGVGENISEEAPAEAVEDVENSIMEEEEEELGGPETEGQEPEGEDDDFFSSEASNLLEKDEKAEEEAAALQGGGEEKTQNSESHTQEMKVRDELEKTQVVEAAKPRRSTGIAAEREGSRRPGPSKEKENQGRRRSFSKDSSREGRRHSFSSEKEVRRSRSLRERETRRASFSSERGTRRWSFSFSEKEVREVPEEEEGVLVTGFDEGEQRKLEEEAKETESRDGEQSTGASAVEVGEEKSRSELPDCLLMMMYEPKLSMEVSKETWVCTSDFTRWRSHTHHNRGAKSKVEQPGREQRKVAAAITCEEVVAPAVPPPPPPPPPPRSQPPPHPTVHPPTPEIVKAVEQKLGNAAAAPYGPFVLTRCKSEPMRSSVKLTPDACFWKSRHLPIGAAGIGF